MPSLSPLIALLLRRSCRKDYEEDEDLSSTSFSSHVDFSFCQSLHRDKPCSKKIDYSDYYSATQDETDVSSFLRHWEESQVKRFADEIAVEVPADPKSEDEEGEIFFWIRNPVIQEVYTDSNDVSTVDLDPYLWNYDFLEDDNDGEVSSSNASLYYDFLPSIPSEISVDTLTFSQGPSDVDGEILDPTQPTIYSCATGKLSHGSAYATGDLLKHAELVGNSILKNSEDAPTIIAEHSVACGIWYEMEAGSTPLFLMHYVASQNTTSLSTLQAVYSAYPEAIGFCNKSLGTPLHYAAALSSLPVVRWLVQRFPHAMTVRNSQGQIPLHMAAQYNGEAVAMYLASQFPMGLQELDQIEDTPLHKACRRGDDFQLAQSLYKAWQNLQRVHKKCVSPFLHVACFEGATLQICQLFVDELKERDFHGQTALHAAIKGEGRYEVLQWLVQVHPKAKQKTNELGRTPLDICRRKPVGVSEQIQQLLEV